MISFEQGLVDLNATELRFLAYDFAPHLYDQWSAETSAREMRQALRAESSRNKPLRAELARLAGIVEPRRTLTPWLIGGSLLLLMVVVMGGVYTLWSEPSPPTPIFSPPTTATAMLTVVVLDQVTQQPLEGVALSLMMDGATFNQPTDSQGVSKFKLGEANGPSDIQLLITHAGYQPKRLTVTVWPNTQQTILLETE